VCYDVFEAGYGMPGMKKIIIQQQLNQKVIDNPESSCNITGIFI
jgi:hypothetical protein